MGVSVNRRGLSTLPWAVTELSSKVEGKGEFYHIV